MVVQIDSGGNIEMSFYAYIRVSCKDQNVARQVAAMRKLGIPDKQMYIDKQSGKNFERTSYKKLLKKLKKGDVLFVKSIDRLGRNYEEVIEQWRYLTKDKQIDIVVLDFPLLDTRKQVNGLTGKFVADLILQILSYVAQMERENIKQRQSEGIRIAKENGVKFGRPKVEIPENFEHIYCLWKEKKISKTEAAKRLETNRTTLGRWIEEYEENDDEFVAG